jgi:putative DNA primase/helicase
VGKWLVWDGRRFRVDEVGEVVQRAKKTALSIYGEAEAQPDPDKRKALAAWAVRTESEHLLREMVALARSDVQVRVTPEQLDANPWYLTVENGTLDLRTGNLFAHSRRDLITKLAPASYHPDATCPTWTCFLNRILAGDAELVAFLQRAIGYSLTGDTREQVLFFLHGNGGNGKTTLLELLLALLGDYAQKADFSTFLERRGEGPRNDLACLRGARLVPAVEAGDGHRLAEGLVKQVTGVIPSWRATSMASSSSSGPSSSSG